MKLAIYILLISFNLFAQQTYKITETVNGMLYESEVSKAKFDAHIAKSKADEAAAIKAAEVEDEAKTAEIEDVAAVAEANEIPESIKQQMKTVSSMCDRDVRKYDVEGAASLNSNLVKSLESYVPTSQVGQSNLQEALTEYGLTAANGLSNECKQKIILTAARDEHELDPGGNRSFDGSITCRDRAPWGLDYVSCIKFIEFYQLSVVGEQVMNVGQQTYATIEQSNIQASLTKKNAAGEFQEAAIDGVKKNANMMATQEGTKAAFYAGKSGMIAAKLITWYGPKNVGEACVEKAPSLWKEVCSETLLDTSFANNSNFAGEVFANSGMKGMLYMQMAEATGKAAISTNNTFAYIKQSSIAGDYQKKLQALKDEELLALDLEKCEAEPGHPDCANYNQRTQGQALELGNVNINSGTGEEFAFDQIDNESIDNGEDLDTPEIAALRNVFGASSQKTSDSFNAPGVKSGSGKGGSAGGGGGGGGSSIGGVSSAGSDKGSAKKGGKRRRSSAGKSARYGASSKGIGYSSRGSKKSKSKERPFSGLFGKGGKNRSVASEIEKSSIMSKKTSLFDKISKRYQWAHKNQKITGLRK